MATRERWLDLGLEVLAADGITAVRIDGLCARLGVSKGSFYHHFDGMPGYRRDLLARYEERFTTSYIDAAEADPDLDPGVRLDRLVDLVLAERDEPDGLDAAMRAWAGIDEVAHATQERIDAVRIGYVQGLWEAATGDAAEAVRMARAICLLQIGSQHVVPPLPADDLRELFDLLTDRRRAPARPGRARPAPTAGSGRGRRRGTGRA